MKEIKRYFTILLVACMVITSIVPAFAAPLSHTKPAAVEDGTQKVTGTWNKDAAGNWHFNSKEGTAKDGWYYLNTTNKATDYNWFHFTNGVMSTGWVQDKANPSVYYYTGEIKDNSEGGLVRGWTTDSRDGRKYYMDPSTGIMCYGWKQIDGVWYYFGEEKHANTSHPYGAMYINESTPDGYYVGSTGAWHQNTSSGSSSRKPDPKPVVKKTVGDILQDDFPTAYDSSWKNENGVALYKYGSGTNQMLKFVYSRYMDHVRFGTELTVKGKDYTCQSDMDATVTFVMGNGVVTSIEFSNPKDTNYTNFIGTYTAPPTDVHVTGVSLGLTKLNLQAGDTRNLTATITPDNATNKNVTWTSSDDDVVTVSNTGEVSAIAEGEATITVTTVDGNKTATCAVKVAAQETYTVTFDLNGATGTAPTAQTIASGSKATKPTDPTFANHTFDGWYKTKDATTGELSDRWDFNTDTVTEDITLYAQWMRETQSILNTYSGFPKTENLTPPANAWVSSTNNEHKAFIGVDADSDTLFIVMKENQAVRPFGLCMDDKFVRIDEDTYKYIDEYVTVTATMEEGVITSCKWKFELDDYKFLNGTYAPKDMTFKAVYNTEDNANTLTFYYDNDTHSEEGTVYDLPSAATKAADWGYNGKRSSVKKVIIDESAKNYTGLTSTAYMFQSMTTAESISGAEYLDVSNVADMTYMFAQFGKDSETLNDVPDVRDWDTSNVAGMKAIFYRYGNGSTELNAVPDVSGWNTGSVKDMGYMFYEYGSKSTVLDAVPAVNGEKWDTSNVKDMQVMFAYYGNASKVLNAVPDVSNWDTSNVKDMQGMFMEYGKSSTVLDAVPDVSGDLWDTSNVTNMMNMFSNYGYSSTALTGVPDVSNWNTEKVTNMGGMFNLYGNSSDELVFSLDLSNWSVTNVTSVNNMFTGVGSSDSTWSVTIPKMTGEQPNDEMHWYIGDGTVTTIYIAPAENRQFTLPEPVSTVSRPKSFGNSIPELASPSNVPEEFETEEIEEDIELDNDMDIPDEETNGKTEAEAPEIIAEVKEKELIEDIKKIIPEEQSQRVIAKEVIEQNVPDEKIEQKQTEQKTD